ncbi:MAG: hypothetical protein IJS60_09920 [Abditibacteriota bacterium]|nr:hypothetical protein [Abditibacteriota bacterium]
MKKFFATLIFMLIVISSYAYNNQDLLKYLEENDLGYLYPYVNNYEVYNYSVFIYPNIININSICHNNNNIRFPYFKKENSNVMEMIKLLDKIDTKEYKFNNKKYFYVTYKYNKNNNFDIFNLKNKRLLAIYNEYNTLIWYSFNSDLVFYKSCLIDLQKSDEMLIVVFYDSTTKYIKVEYIDDTNKTPIIIHYRIPRLIEGANYCDIIEKGKLISDNIIRIKYKDSNNIEYWKIKITENDRLNFDKMKFDPEVNKDGKVLEDFRLLWCNPEYKSKYFKKDTLLHYNKSFDYFEQDTEPTIEQLKEKFPYDTFFGDEVGDKEDNTFSENVYKNKDENIESPK